MIDFSAIYNSLPEVNVDPHERDYEPDCERPGNVAPGQMTWIGASVAPALAYARAPLHHQSIGTLNHLQSYSLYL